MASMADYLSTVTPDYSATVLNVAPQRVIQMQGGFNQITHKPDGGDDYIVTLSTEPEFYCTLQWDAIKSADKNTILDFYFNVLKAKGMARSFLWYHPVEAVNYVVKFKSEINESLMEAGYYAYSGITLRVIGVPS